MLLNGMKPEVLLVPPSARLVKQAISRTTAMSMHWVYLGDSVRKLRWMMRWLGPDPQRIIISDVLQAAAKSLRESYINYIGKLTSTQDSEIWWLSSLSEKDPPPKSKAFLHICYVTIAAQLCHQRTVSGALILVIESRGVQSALAQYLRENGVRFVEMWDPSIVRRVARGLDWIEMVARWGHSVLRHLYRMIVARIEGFAGWIVNGPTSPGTQPWVLIHNWVDARSFDSSGGYRDVYFGQLREELQKQGLRVAIVASILYGSAYRYLLKKLKGARIPVVVPHASLTIGTLLRWSWSLISRPPRPRIWPRFGDVDVSTILDEEERRDWVKKWGAYVLPVSDILSQWRRHFDVGTFIYTYEGHSWEKSYCRAFRELFPHAFLVGHQHTTMSPLWLSHFMSPFEWGKIPFPDRLVTNGRYHYDLLRQNGIPEEVLACGGTLRYSTLGKSTQVSHYVKPAGSVVRVLVTLSPLRTQAAELLLAVREAFVDPDAFHVVLKDHPRLPFHRTIKDAGLRSLPPHMKVVDQGVPDLLRDADVLVYTESTSALEALASGVPIVHFASSCTIDLDPLESFKEIRISTGRAEGLRGAVLEMAALPDGERNDRAQRWLEVVSQLLPKPDGSIFTLFMPRRALEASSSMVQTISTGPSEKQTG